MSGIPALASLAPRSLRGTLGSWLQGRLVATWRSFEALPIGAGELPFPDNDPVRVLVVDDNPVNLMVISGLLESRGLVPVLAADGAEAVALARELQFDLILMDLQMPILDGLRATSAIRNLETHGSRPPVPVIAYTSSSPAARDLATHGLNGSLTKPCSPQELEDCLVQWCPKYRSGPVPRAVARADTGWALANRHPGTSCVASRAPPE